MARDVTVARQREDVEVLDPWRGRCDDTFENRAELQVLELFHSSTNFAILKAGRGSRPGFSVGCAATGQRSCLTPTAVAAGEIATLAPEGDRRVSANSHANGGILRRELVMPDFADYAVTVAQPGQSDGEATRIMGVFLRDVIKQNHDFRLFGPDETASNRLSAVFEVTDRAWVAQTLPEDDHLSRDGHVMEILSEHTCEGWLEGYLLTGRHGLFSCYEAFIHIADSMFNQHAKWPKESREILWRQPISSLNYLLTSHVWRQEHNGFSHQDPGLIDHVVNKKGRHHSGIFAA
jgi:phosphoketolase